MLDVIQISYFEENADEHFEILQMFAPHAKRVEGVKGIFEAHKAAAKIAETNCFYVVDADAVIEETFKFNFKPSSSKKALNGEDEALLARKAPIPFFVSNLFQHRKIGAILHTAPSRDYNRC